MVELTRREATLSLEYLGFDLDRIGFSDEEQDELGSVYDKLQDQLQSDTEEIVLDLTKRESGVFKLALSLDLARMGFESEDEDILYELSERI